MIEKEYKMDFAHGVQKTVIRHVLAQKDSKANTFDVACTRNGAAEDLTGATVSGYFIRADDATISLSGSVSGNVVSVTLESACYSVEGRCYIIVKLTKGDDTTTIFWAEGSVSLTQTDTIVVTEEKVVNLEEMLARVDAAATQAEEAAANASAAQASIEASKETVDKATEVVDGAQAAADRANAAAAAVEGMDVSALTAQINALKAATTPTVLWSGDWSSGSKTVEGIGDWFLLGIQTGLGFIVGINSGGTIRASGFLGNAGNHISVNLSMAVSGSTVTMSINSRYNHTAGSDHGSDNTTTIKSIIGLMKAGNMTIQE